MWSAVEAVVQEEAEPGISYHDLRLVHGSQGVNAVFDLMLPWAYGEEQAKELVARIRRRVQEKDSRLNCIITLEHGYGG